MTKDNEQNFELLSSLLLKIRNKQEALNFLQDIFSNKELGTLALRVQIAKMLHEGLSYIEIEKATGLSSATIAKVNEALKYGRDGLRTVLERIKRTK